MSHGLISSWLAMLRPHGGEHGRRRAWFASDARSAEPREDGGDVRVRRASEALDDHVREAARLGGRRPLAKPRVADEPDRRASRFERGDLVRAGGGQEAVRMERRPGGHGVGRGERELVEEVGVGRGEVEGDGVRAGVGHDPLREVARLLRGGEAAPARRRCRRSTARRRRPGASSSVRSIARRKSCGRTSAPVE